MTDMPIIDRWRLPSPVLERERGFWELYVDRREQLQALWQSSQALQKISPDFDTWLLQTEPAVILLQVAAFGDVHFVKEMNDWARVTLLAHFAKGSDLDAHAEREGLRRFPGESDEALLARIILERKGKNAYGTDPWYMRHARNVDTRVHEVAITGNGRRRVEIAILSTDNGGVPSLGLLDKLQAILSVAPVKRNNDIVSVVPAILTATDIEADYWLEDDAPRELLDGMEATIAERWNTGTRLGRDLTQSWYRAQIHVPGVYKVEGITPDIIVAQNRGVAVGNVKLNYRGRNR